MTAPLIVLLIVSISVAADYFLKLASGKADGHTTPEFLFAAALYVVTAGGFLLLMRHMTLASIAVWYSILTILFMTGLGVFVFKEAITSREVFGILLAFGALGMMSRFA